MQAQTAEQTPASAEVMRDLVNALRLALGIALEEIHHPGAARARGLDITVVIEHAIRLAAGA